MQGRYDRDKQGVKGEKNNCKGWGEKGPFGFSFAFSHNADGDLGWGSKSAAQRGSLEMERDRRESLWVQEEWAYRRVWTGGCGNGGLLQRGEVWS